MCEQRKRERERERESVVELREFWTCECSEMKLKCCERDIGERLVLYVFQ